MTLCLAWISFRVCRCNSRRGGRLAVVGGINELSIVGRSEDDVWLEIVAVHNQLSEHRFTCRDPLDGVCATK